MPMIRVQLSSPLDKPKQASLLKSLSATVAGVLGKPESYMMVVLQPDVPILMGGRNEPAAFFEVRSVGTISGEQAAKLSAQVSDVLGEATGLPAERIYSNYTGVPGTMWGHDGGTFG
jgi:phenylpyruvate tautomerase